MEILFVKDINKGALKCTVDVKIPQWGNFIIRRIKVFEKGGDSWVSLPSEEYEKDGQKKYFALNTFEDMEMSKKFESQVLSKLKEKSSTQQSQAPVFAKPVASKSNTEDVDFFL